MKFDIYGRFQLEVTRESDTWVVYRLGLGTRARSDLVIPSSVTERELATYLDDAFHELSGPTDRIRKLS
jgi:hypothetical protein